MKIENQMIFFELNDKCPKCNSNSLGTVVCNSESYIALKGIHGGTEILKCTKCGCTFHSSTYSYKRMVK